MAWNPFRNDSNPKDDAALPQRTDKAARHAKQADAARIERVRGVAREAEGSVGGRPGREGGTDFPNREH